MAIQKLVDEILAFDKDHDIEDSNRPTIRNLLFFSNALAGETGEVANDVKKMLRDGPSPELLADFKEELIDVLIYILKLGIITGTDFDEEWKKKMIILEERWQLKKGGYWHTKRDVDESILP